MISLRRLKLIWILIGLKAEIGGLNCARLMLAGSLVEQVKSARDRRHFYKDINPLASN